MKIELSSTPLKSDKHRALRNAETSRRQVEQERDHYREEHAKLKALIDFQKKASSSTSDSGGKQENKKGVLDSDDL